jgi:glycosyltransferase involved in cell wall biosynthesis
VPDVIVVNGRFLRSRPSGMHRVGRELLDAARRNGLECEVLAPAGVTDHRVDRVVHGLPTKAGDLVWEQTTLPWAGRGSTILSLAQTAPLLGRRNAVLVNDLAPLVGPQWFGRSMQAYEKLVLASARHAPLVLTPTETVAGELRDVGVPADRLVVVQYAVGEKFRPAPAAAVKEVQRRHGLRPPYLLMVGWADPRKDVATAVKAHLAAAADHPHELVVVGQQHGTFADADVPTADSVHYLGYVDEQDMVPLLTGAAALVYTSLYEGFGLPPLEAIACGTPALVSDIPVLRETGQGQPVYLPTGEVDAWARAMVDALAGQLPEPELPPWTWDDAGRVLVEALGRLA